MSIVMLVWLSSRSSSMTLGCTPILSRMVAALCRRSWKRISRSPAPFNSVLKRSTTFDRFSGVPTAMQKTRPRSCHASLACRFVSDWRSWCACAVQLSWERARCSLDSFPFWALHRCIGYPVCLLLVASYCR